MEQSRQGNDLLSVEWTQDYLENRQQLKELPMVHKMLPLTEKSTRKLELKNLQAAIDKRDFDLELEERSIYQSIKLITDNARQLTDFEDEQLISMVRDGIAKFREENVQRFDEMNSVEEKLQLEIERLTQSVPELAVNASGLESISDDESDYLSDEQPKPEQRKGSNIEIVHAADLPARVEEIDAKLKAIGGAKAKWLESDHREFVKVYTRSKGNQERIVKGCMEILGMNNIEILEHLEHYEKYLQLDNQKKVLAAEYKRSKEEKLLGQRLRKQAEEKKAKQLQLLKQRQAAAERERKKQQVKEFKDRKHSEEKKVDEQKVTKLKQQTEAKEAKRAASLAQSKRKLEEHANFKAQEQKKLLELQQLLKTKTELVKPAPLKPRPPLLKPKK